MAELTPVDKLTQLPLLFAPHEGVSPVIQGLQQNGGLFDWNHVFHPRRDPILTESLGGEAVRQSRMQLVHRTEQHEPYHEAFVGPPLPISPEAQFRTVLLCAAGYVPPQALDFSHRKPEVVKLNNAQLQQLRTGNEIRQDLRYGAADKVAAFMRSHVLTHEIEGISRETMDTFLALSPDTSANERQLELLTDQIVRGIVRGAVSSTRRMYTIGYRRGLLAPYAPKNPVTFVADQLSGPTQETYYNLVAVLREKVAKIRERDLARPSPVSMPQILPVGRIAIRPWMRPSTGSALA